MLNVVFVDKKRENDCDKGMECVRLRGIEW